MTLTLGFSPCPNDTFIFDALVNGKIDTEGLQFNVLLEDVQTLNNWAREQKLDISKISYGNLPFVLDHYSLLESGGALGMGVGPLLIAKKPIDPADISRKLVAIPGENTTAHLLFSLVYPEAVRKEFMVFHEIEDAVLQGRVDAGVIIHENRFTYQQKGLHKITDLGEAWESKMQVPIPLGGIVARRTLPPPLVKKVDRLIRKSLEFAFAYYPEITPYVKQHAQEMNENVMRQHIDLYVNKYSLSLGMEGRKALATLLEISGRDASNVFLP